MIVHTALQGSHKGVNLVRKETPQCVLRHTRSTPKFVAGLCLKVATDQDVLQSWPSIDDQVPRRAVLRRVFSRGRGGGAGVAALRGALNRSQFEPEIIGGRGGGGSRQFLENLMLCKIESGIFLPHVLIQNQEEKYLCCTPNARQHQRTNRLLAADPFHSIFAIVCNGSDL